MPRIVYIDLADSGGFRKTRIQFLGLLVGHPDDCGLPECIEGCDTVVDLGLGVTACESPGIVDSCKGQQALGDITDCESDTAGCGTEVDGDGSWYNSSPRT